MLEERIMYSRFMHYVGDNSLQEMVMLALMSKSAFCYIMSRSIHLSLASISIYKSVVSYRWPQFNYPAFKVISSKCVHQIGIGEQISTVRCV